MIYSNNRTKLNYGIPEYASFAEAYYDVMHTDCELFQEDYYLLEAVDLKKAKDTIVNAIKAIIDKAVELIGKAIAAIKRIAGDIKKKIQDKKYQVCLNRAKKLVKKYGWVAVLNRTEPIDSKYIADAIPKINSSFNISDTIEIPFRTLSNCTKGFKDAHSDDIDMESEIAEEYKDSIEYALDKIENGFKNTIDSFDPSRDFFKTEQRDHITYSNSKGKTKDMVVVNSPLLDMMEKTLTHPEAVINQITKKLEANENSLKQCAKEMEEDLNSVIDTCMKGYRASYYNSLMSSTSNFLTKCSNLISTAVAQISEKALKGFDDYMKAMYKIIVSCAVNIKAGKPVKIDDDDYEDDDDVPSAEFKKTVADGNKLRVKIMLKDSLIVDPTFGQFNAELSYAEKEMGAIYEEGYRQKLKTDKSSWSWDYCNELLASLINNGFTKEKIDLLQKMIPYLLQHDGIESN